MNQHYTVRHMQPGQRFLLRRTGDRYTLVRRELNPRYGMTYVVQHEGNDKETTLHPQCYVKPIIRAAS